MQHRFALLLLLAALCAAGAALLHRGSGKSAGRSTTVTTTQTVTTTTGRSVLGTTTSATVTMPPRPTTTVPRLPRAHQPVPGKTPRPAGDDLATQSDVAARQQLEAFLATRPDLEPYEEAIWYSAHYSYSNVTPRGLAGLVWCVGFRIEACNRANDAAQR